MASFTHIGQDAPIFSNQIPLFIGFLDIHANTRHNDVDSTVFFGICRIVSPALQSYTMPTVMFTDAFKNNDISLIFGVYVDNERYFGLLTFIDLYQRCGGLCLISALRRPSAAKKILPQSSIC